MGKSIKLSCFFFILSVIPHDIFSQDGVQAVPNSLRRPERGEAPRYPNDLVIGELGRGGASEGSYLFARNLIAALISGRRDAPVFTDSGSFLAESIFEEVKNIRPRNFRLGGGRYEPDGCVSFLVRFIGPDESITGELFVRQAEEDDEGSPGRWLLDDLMLENKRAHNEINDSYRYNFSPYERFY